jgi:hypothetical protein
MDTGWTTHIVIGIVAALVVGGLISFGGRRPADKQGWRSVRPGAMYVAGIGGGTLLTVFFAAIWLFVGSSRPDGESQMRVLFWLILAFGSGTLITLLQYRKARNAAMQWRGDVLRWHDGIGTTHSRRIGEAVALRRALMGPVHVVFGDGLEARIDPYANHALDLIEAIAKRLDPGSPGPGRDRSE